MALKNVGNTIFKKMKWNADINTTKEKSHWKANLSFCSSITETGYGIIYPYDETPSIDRMSAALGFCGLSFNLKNFSK